MKPIINPWIFYFASVADAVLIVSIIFAVVVGIFCILCGADLLDEYTPEQDIKAAKKRLKLCVPIFIILTLFTIFIPSKKTIYEMTIASYITEENIENSKETAMELIDYIVDKFNNKGDDE